MKSCVNYKSQKLWKIHDEPDPFQRSGSSILSESGSGYGSRDFDDQKLKEKKPLKFFLLFCSKTVIYLFLGLHKGRLSYRRSIQPSKREHPALQKMKFMNFFLFFWVFFALLDPDP
jgi:hypothetical protein